MDRQAADRIKRLQEGLAFLITMIKERNGDEEVCDIIAKDIDAGLSDSQATYLDRLLAELRAEKHMPVVLLYLNFNSRKYFHHWVENLNLKLNTDESDTEKLERLRLEQKMVNQLPCEFNVGYSDRYPPLKQMITEWIAEEIHFLERGHRFNSTVHSIEGDFVKPGFKLEFNMSVSQFAYFVKSFIESGVIQNKNITELIRFLSKFVKTRNSENVGYESFRSKYYHGEDGTRNSVKNLLHNVIEYINSH